MDNNQKNMTKYIDLEKAISESKIYAVRGEKLANETIDVFEKTVKVALDEISKHREKINEKNIVGTTSHLIKQFNEIRDNYSQLPKVLKDDLSIVSTNKFSITLFGRTMAGKSTLMEILTNGDGKSIGNGSQRTTLDVRTYPYKNMEITDVPGISAFHGSVDEQVAFDAAKKSDLILFLITDDAPQASEAECLSNVLKLGKPVICLINIKVDIREGTSFKMFKRDLEKKMQPERLKDIREQFLSFGELNDQKFVNLRFINLHLKAAFLSQQPEWEEHKEELYKLSSLEYFENAITNEVINNGRFYKLKSFADIVINPIINAQEELFKQSIENSKQGVLLIGKKNKLNDWSKGFEKNSIKRIDFFLAQQKSFLRQEIGSFAENHYSDKNVDFVWKQKVNSFKIDKRVDSFLKGLGYEADRELREISREIKQELIFINAEFNTKTINDEEIVNSKKIWNWSIVTIAGTLGILGLALPLFGVAAGTVAIIMSVGAGVGLVGSAGSIFFKSKEEKIFEARKKLEVSLNENIEAILANYREQMLDYLYNNLLKAQVYPTINKISQIVTSLFMISEVQHDFAKKLSNELIKVNKKLIVEAIEYLGFSGLEYHILDVVRIPGNTLMLELRDGTKFPEDAKNRLSGLLKERVCFVFYKINIESRLLQAIGKDCDRKKVSIEKINGKPTIAHIKDYDTLDTNTKNRVRLAQQLTQLLVMK